QCVNPGDCPVQALRFYGTGGSAAGLPLRSGFHPAVGGLCVTTRFADSACFRGCMNKSIWMLLLLLCAPPVPAAEPVAGADQILGLWVTDKGAAHVEIYREQGLYHGRLVWLAEPLYPADDPEAGESKHDRNNPDPARRKAPLLGLQIMQGFRAVAEGRWQGG